MNLKLVVEINIKVNKDYIIDKNGDLYMISINNGQIVDSYESKDL